VTFDEIARSLPNGLHDAELMRINVDYARGLASVFLRIDMADGESQAWYRDAEIRLSGVSLLSIEPPREIPLNAAKALWIDSGSGRAPKSEGLFPMLPEGTFLQWLYVSEWNAFIHVAARHAELVWL
jgi:hypothetical protein